MPRYAKRKRGEGPCRKQAVYKRKGKEYVLEPKFNEDGTPKIDPATGEQELGPIVIGYRWQGGDWVLLFPEDKEKTYVTGSGKTRAEYEQSVARRAELLRHERQREEAARVFGLRLQDYDQFRAERVGQLFDIQSKDPYRWGGDPTLTEFYEEWIDGPMMTAAQEHGGKAVLRSLYITHLLVSYRVDDEETDQKAATIGDMRLSFITVHGLTIMKQLDIGVAQDRMAEEAVMRDMTDEEVRARKLLQRPVIKVPERDEDDRIKVVVIHRKGIGPKRFKDLRALLIQMFDAAQGAHYRRYTGVIQNPIKEYRMIRPVTKSRRQKSTPIEIVDLLVDAAIDMGDLPMANLIILCLHGIRPSAGRALSWLDWDEALGHFSVEKQIRTFQGRPQEFRTKNGLEYDAPIAEPYVPILRKIKELTGSELIVPVSLRRPFEEMKEGSVWERWQAVIAHHNRKQPDEAKHISTKTKLYDAKSALASKLAESGVKPAQVAAILGISEEVAKRHYIKLDDAVRRAMVQRTLGQKRAG
jgi:hypothetical protein